MCFSTNISNFAVQSPKTKHPVAEPPYDADWSAFLSRKKLNHGRFEDPYKSKVLCWSREGKFYVLPVSPDRTTQGMPVEEIDIISCQVLDFFNS